MKYKMIVTDLDDTLLTSNGTISEENKQAIIKAQESGIKFVLASGRPTFAMKHLVKELQLDKFGSYIITYNGAMIVDCKDFNEIFTHNLLQEDIHSLYNFSKENGVEIITYIGDDIISETKSEYVDVEITLTKMNFKKVDSFKHSVEISAPKCIMLEEPQYLEKVQNILKKNHGDKYSIAISKPYFLEVTKKDVDKGQTLLRLAKDLDINPEEIIAVGDSYNDVTMLQVVGLPVAVENAKEELKSIAKFITTSNENHGLKTVIEKYIF